jgi:hypothetical protein
MRISADTPQPRGKLKFFGSEKAGVDFEIWKVKSTGWIEKERKTVEWPGPRYSILPPSRTSHN